MRSPAFYRALDDETVALLEAGSHDGDPRTLLVDCGFCGRPFWRRASREYRGGPSLHLYCSASCRSSAYHYRHHPVPDDDRARARFLHRLLRRIPDASPAA